MSQQLDRARNTGSDSATLALFDPDFDQWKMFCALGQNDNILNSIFITIRHAHMISENYTNTETY